MANQYIDNQREDNMLSQIEKLEVEYQLAEDDTEKVAIKLALQSLQENKK